ncbi:hypothetical protein BH09PSE3_BH09PSE3_09700 [soil metagenome]
MSGIDTARKLSRLRDMERRLAGASLATAAAGLNDAEGRIERLKHLSVAIAVEPGLVGGNLFAAGAECVSRLLTGCVATAIQRDHQIYAVETARGAFAVADARAQIAGRHLVVAEQAESKSAELKTALKMPVRGFSRCR